MRKFFWALQVVSGLILCLASCQRSPVGEAFALLDETIGNNDIYRERFEHKNDSLRVLLENAGTDSLKWAYANKLHSQYRHYSLDSSARYLSFMRDYAVTDRQKNLSRFAHIRLLEWFSDPKQALAVYRDLDTTGFEAMGLTDEYLKLGVNVFINNARFTTVLEPYENYADSLKLYQEKLIGIDTVSFEGKKTKAQYLRSQGEYQKALDIFLSCQSQVQGIWRDMSSLAYNIGILYGDLNDFEQKKLWLAKSGIYDMYGQNRDLLSLYELALTLYHEGDLKRASKYIGFHFDQVFSGEFRPKMIWSSRAYNIIVDASREADHNKRIILACSIAILSLFLLIIFILWAFASRQSKQRIVALLQLEKVNKSLAEANKIKENYVFRYMNLCIRYIDKSEESRREYRHIAKNQGQDALLKILRAPADYADHKEFYRIFDNTFLGIFPDFVKKVNALLNEDARFDEASTAASLPTELRILALIKLGIEDSPRIASFFKCSLSTVYTYRARMRNQALCPKEEFENRVKSID